jgi:hypothetical protein
VNVALPGDERVDCSIEEAEAMLLRRTWLAVAALVVVCGGGVVMVACATGSVTGSGDDTVGDDATNGSPDGAQGADGGVTHHGDASCDANLSNDPYHCGSCDNACGSGQVCSVGKCGAQCTAPTLKCGDAGCVDITKDPLNCGNCGTVCIAPEGGAPASDGGGDNGQRVAQPTCTSMTCGYACPQGSTECGDAGCWDTTIAHDYCGSCNNACTATEVCSSSMCCPTGDVVCAGACTNVQTDTKNCGSCNNACTATGETCNAGMCACPASQTVCSGACTDTQTDAKNCGTCGKVCPAMQPTCVAGQCMGCGTNDVSYNGHCYYLDGSKGVCDPGYALVSQSILTSIHSMFAGLNYKHTISQDCCVLNADPTENWGMADHCNANGPFDANDPSLGAYGCSGVSIDLAGQLTLCGK